MRRKAIFNKVLTLTLAVAFVNPTSLVAENNQTEPKKFKVVLDAGHGGKDSGNRGNGYYEKNIALNVVLALGKELEKQKDIEVIYTRKSDVFLELWERADIANNAKADLFVSIHCNSHSSQASGTETFVLGINGNAKNMEIAKKENSVILLEDNYEERYAGFDPQRPESIMGLEIMQEEYLDQSLNLAAEVENEFSKVTKSKSRGVKQNIFWVLHRSVMPSVLIETGFLTNNQEGKFLNSKDGQEKMAGAIAKAVSSYKKRIQLNEAVGLVEEKIDSNPESKTVSVEKEQIVEGYTFKVQLAASNKKLEPKSYNFKGLQEISRSEEDNLYKYFSGETSNYTEIRKRLELAKDKGYTSAFIVSYDKSNIKVPLSQVLN